MTMALGSSAQLPVPERPAALALRAQMVGEDEVVPVDENDETPDVLVTPDGEIK